jgi:hypothetical protein
MKEEDQFGRQMAAVLLACRAASLASHRQPITQENSNIKQVLLILTAILYISAPLCRASAAEARKPNIVFLFADDQRPDTIAAHGNPNIRTPNLDRLA